MLASRLPRLLDGPVSLGGEAGRGVTAQGVSGTPAGSARMPPGLEDGLYLRLA